MKFSASLSVFLLAAIASASAERRSTPLLDAKLGGNRENQNRCLRESLTEVTSWPILNDPSTAQGKAYAWLRDFDSATTDFCTYPALQQRYALATLYESTNGAGWGRSNGWLTAAPECKWDYVLCNGDGLVTELYMFELGMSGSIPEEIKVFSSIEYLSFNTNEVGGEIPDVFDNMPFLEKLFLDSNYLTGKIPASIFNIPALKNLALCFNDLSGNIPPNLGGAPKLETLFLHGNDLDGTIPSIQDGQLTTLETIYVQSNDLSGSVPSSICDLKQDGSLNLMLTDCNVECACCGACTP